MLAWDVTDVIDVLEVLPEIAENAKHTFTVERDGLQLQLSIEPRDGDVYASLTKVGHDSSIFTMQIVECQNIRMLKFDDREFLEFAGVPVSYGVYEYSRGIRLAIKPTIYIQLY